ncbi:hypothetical protein A2818_01625 [Candidatus Nomurabacteria bacterium RIFCSPHIGHO2_01_FULL_40_12]|uniref:LytR/CpsA/Psr regulator C-terminal domain-containing protein n=1 Tax=Candidatus Nomurabacteria bacterium RIFCSPHIGHO2_01_FULL_40_12 TaxID=1801737 RepID=A0A1F6V0Z6_9BACT|nr:MAG: hypothetical protein A2818_01625 [Candidatus Nomurabacteria bacterium RIFCSPHIGHO2_01_FULL_40_12]
MKLKDINLTAIIQKIKSTKLSDFIYSGVIFLLVIIVIISFSYSTNFIVKNINKIFSPEDTGGAQALNMENYLLVVKKLNLPLNTQKEDTPENTNTLIVEPVIPPVEDTIIPTPAPIVELDKKSITINILNSTAKKGVASTLAKTLEDAGFSKAETGNEKKSYDLTTIIVSDAKKEYAPLVLEVVSKSYPKAVTETATATGETKFDVTIIIGKE